MFNCECSNFIMGRVMSLHNWKRYYYYKAHATTERQTRPWFIRSLKRSTTYAVPCLHHQWHYSVLKMHFLRHSSVKCRYLVVAPTYSVNTPPWWIWSRHGVCRTCDPSYPDHAICVLSPWRLPYWWNPWCTLWQRDRPGFSFLPHLATVLLLRACPAHPSP